MAAFLAGADASFVSGPGDRGGRRLHGRARPARDRADGAVTPFRVTIGGDGSWGRRSLEPARWVSALALAPAPRRPRLSPSELEKQVDAEHARVTALDAEFSAFRGERGAARGGHGAVRRRVLQLVRGEADPTLEPGHAQGVHQMLSRPRSSSGARPASSTRARRSPKQFAAPWSLAELRRGPARRPVRRERSGAARVPRRGDRPARAASDGGSVRLVTVWNDDGDRIEAADGADTPCPPSPPAGAQADPFARTTASGPSKAGALRSSPRSSARSRCSARRSWRDLGLPFRRRSSAPERHAQAAARPLPGEFKQCGLYRWPGETRIEIYDCAFDRDDLASSADRSPAAAVGARDRRTRSVTRSARGHRRPVRPHVRENGEARELAEEFNRQGRRIIRARSPATSRCRRRSRDDLGHGHRWQVALNGGAATLSPVIEQFDQVRGETGFTVYGRWNTDEAFAEAFSLYRADPDACKRISPPVFAYFDSGRHAAASGN